MNDGICNARTRFASLKHRDPFIPFQIVMTSGDRYLIEDPDDLSRSAKSNLHYYFPEVDKFVFIANAIRSRL